MAAGAREDPCRISYDIKINSDMEKRIIKQGARFLCGAIVFLALFAWAGTVDYTVEVVESMPRGVYMAVKSVVGHDASDYKVVREYMAHKDMYDELYSED